MKPFDLDIRGLRSVAFPAVVLLVSLVTAFQARPQRAIQANVLANPGFEEERAGLPAGWNLDAGLRAKGAARLDRTAFAGQYALELSPNSKNTDTSQLFGFAQLIPANEFAGRRTRVQAALKANGGATATVLVFAVAAGFKPLNHVSLEQSQSAPAFQVLSESFDVDPKAAQILIACAVKGTSGRAWFDEISFGLEADAHAEAPRDNNRQPAAGAQEAALTIDAAQVLRSIPRTLYGTNIEWINDGNGIWDASQNRPRPEILAPARELGVSLIRYPGGIFSDYYHWRDGIGPAASRPVRPHVADGGKSRNSFGTDELMQFCRMIGAEPLMQVNIVTGTPQEAADWVAYCNRPDHAERAQNGSRPPYKVHYWEIGNEPYGKSDNKQISASSLTPEEYAKRYMAFAAAMKAVDSSIALVGTGGYNSGKYVAVSNNAWNRVLLERVAPAMDFLAVHNAYAPLGASASRASFDDVYRALLVFPRLISRNLDEVAQQVRTYGGANAGRIQLAITEWGPFFHAIPSDPWVGHTKTLGSALFVGSAMQSFLRSPQTSMANFFKLSDATFMGWIDAQGNPKPSYYALQMYTHHFGRDLVRVDVTAPRFNSRAVGNVDATNDTAALDAVASLSADRAHLYAIVVNRSASAPIRAGISIRGFKPAPTGRGWLLTASSLDANNGNDLPAVPGLRWAKQMEAPAEAMFSQGRPGTVVPREIGIPHVSGNFTFTFPPISMTAIELAQ
jgi:alpha-N-arabinofuranosidase